MKTTLPAGKYYIGDPCYVISDWDGFLEIFWALPTAGGGIFDFDVGVCCVYQTMWGDGQYETNDGSLLPVDAGLIGAIPIELVTQGGEEDGMYVTFNEPFGCHKDSNGRLHFGDVNVMTGDEEAEEDCCSDCCR